MCGLLTWCLLGEIFMNLLACKVELSVFETHTDTPDVLVLVQRVVKLFASLSRKG